jgi:predicted DNA-binding protein with PD1-like motif
LKFLFKIAKERGKDVEGDFIALSKKKEHVEFDTSLHTSTLTKGREVIFHLKPKDGPLMAKLGTFLEENKLHQGYITCDNGILNDMKCAFFLTKHKPSPTFGKAYFAGENKITSISGFFLIIPSSKEDKRFFKTVPHLHVVFQNTRTRKTFSGHLDDAESGNIELKIMPLSGKTMRRETDPNTGGMYLRAEKREDFKPKVGDTILFAFGPEEDFPNTLFKRMSSYQIRKAKYSFAIGTLWSIRLEGYEKKSNITPKDGLELSLTSGEVSFEKGKYSHNTNVQLTDRFGRQYEGQLVSGKVKDILEGAIEVIS